MHKRAKTAGDREISRLKRRGRTPAATHTVRQCRSGKSPKHCDFCEGFGTLHKRTGSTAKLIATGRDIEQRELTLEFDRDSHLWNLVSNDTEHTSSPADTLIAAVKDYLQREEIFIGSPTELAEQLGVKRTPSVLSKILKQNQRALAAQGIQYSSTRTGQSREITLLYDSIDSNDGKSDTAPLPNLLSQASLPSHRPP